MPFIAELKERLTATQDTKKITQSLQLVAANKMKGFVRQAYSTRSYAWKLLDMLQALDGEQLSGHGRFFIAPGPAAPPLYVLVTSDKGLCGNLNQRLIRHLFGAGGPAAGENFLLATVGRKAAEAARRKGIVPCLSFVGLGENLTPWQALQVIEPIIQLYLDGSCSRVILVSPHYVNPFLSHPTMKTYLPLSREMAESHFQHRVKEAVTVPEHLDHEPSLGKVADALERQVAEAVFLQAFYELKAAEYASRMVAMKKATEAAAEVFTTLQLELNKARQNAITAQLSELAAAAEAMSEESDEL